MYVSGLEIGKKNAQFVVECGDRTRTAAKCIQMERTWKR